MVVATHHPVFDDALLSTRLTQDPGGMYITEESGKRSVRTSPLAAGGRLLIITGEAFTPGTGEDTEGGYARLEDRGEQHFPGFSTIHRRAAQDNSSTDTLPLVGRLPMKGDNVYVATGFAGWGMTGGVMAGTTVASLVRGGEDHFVKDRRDTLGDGTNGRVEDLQPGKGTVIRAGGKPCAVHRDERGELHAVSAVCTHLG